MFAIIYQGASEIWKIIKDLLSLPVRHCALFILISTDELQFLAGRNYGVSFRGRNWRRDSTFGCQCLFSPRKRPCWNSSRILKSSYFVWGRSNCMSSSSYSFRRREHFPRPLSFGKNNNNNKTETLPWISREIFCAFFKGLRTIRTKMK